LKNLNSRIQQKILFTLEKFKEGKSIDIIKLKNKSDEFRIRTGRYRIQIQKVEEGFLVTKIGKRENFYGVFL
jgi:mRNA-degrading endonuclease RelE of RelBE toxin-antitoxin system